MKKILSLVLALSLMVTATACGGKSASTSQSQGNPGGQSASSAGPTAGGLKMEDVKVCVFLSSVRGDSGIIDMLADAADELAEEEGLKNYTIVEAGDAASDTAKLKSTLMDVCDQGWDIVISSSSTMLDIVGEVAPDYPDTKFCLFDTAFDFDTYPYDNVYSATFKANEGSYLAGIVAMSMSESGTIGFVGGQEVSSILDFCWGYVEGAKSVNPDGKIVITFTNDWYDSAKAKEIAISEVNMGADVIFPAAGPSSEGVMEAASEKGIRSIGVDEDREALYAKTNPDWVSSILTSEIKDVNAAVKRAIHMTLDGTLKYGESEALGLESGCVGIIETGNYAQEVPDEVKALVEEAKKGALEGTLKITSAYGKSTEEVQKMKDWANGTD